jgi:hypothetical protein
VQDRPEMRDGISNETFFARVSADS